MNSTPPVSVLMCTNVDNAWVEDAISSVVSQSFGDFEFIIVANGLDDDEYVRLSLRCSDKRIRLIRTDLRGITFSLNFGLHAARGPLIIRMDSDDFSCPNRFSTLVEFMAENREVCVCGSSFALIDANRQRTAIIHPPQSNRAIRRALRFRNPLCHPSVIFRREPVVRAGGYAGNGMAEDYELWIRLAEDRQSQFRNLDIALLEYRMTPLGAARRARRAYIQTAAAQIRGFFLQGNPLWLLGAGLSIGKAFAKGRS